MMKVMKNFRATKRFAQTSNELLGPADENGTCVCCDCGAWFSLEGDPLPRCCPSCHSPHWQGSRELDNYPAQEGVRGVGGTVRNFESMERVNRNRD